MRKYQQRQVNVLRKLYQSNDPLRWWLIAYHLNVYYPLSKREARIARRRVEMVVSHVAENITKVIKVFAVAAKNAAEAFTSMAKAMKRPKQIQVKSSSRAYKVFVATPANPHKPRWAK